MRGKTMVKGRDGEVRLLGRMTNLAASCLTWEETLAVAARFFPQLFPGDAGALFIRPANRDLYEPVLSWGPKDDWRAFSAQDCWSLRRRRLHSVREEKNQPSCPHTDHDPERWISLCVPMTDRGDALGVFQLLIPVGHEDRGAGEGWAKEGEEGGAQPETRTEAGDAQTGKRRLATLTADIMTLLLVNLRLRRQFDELSVRDLATGCFNRRHLEDTLTRELKIRQRSGGKLSVILMDIDHFGQFTEDFGHGASSMVLKELGNFLRENIREADLVCRYGADEFALLFPDTDLSTAGIRAEHLRAMIGDLSRQEGRGRMRRITLSMGVAACPEHGETMGDLMEAVKKALEKAKQTGRDRVCRAE